MKKLLAFAIVLFLISCQSKTEKSSEIPMTKLEPAVTEKIINSEETSDELNPQLAVDFMNSYIKSRMGEYIDILEWTEANPNASEKLKSALKEMYDKAWEEDPIVGLGFDPFFDAQDFPMTVELSKFDKETGYVTIKGICDWDEYRVRMKVIDENGKMLVDGCGVVNIPEDKQARR